MRLGSKWERGVISWLVVLECVVAQISVQPEATPNCGRVGRVAATQGNVHVAREGLAARPLHRGDSIFFGDTITTDADGRLQMLLMDDTMATVNADCALIIDKFIYHPAGDPGERGAAILRGLLRLVTGAFTPESAPADHLPIPAGVIGIRG